MGLEIDRDRFAASDYRCFRERLDQSLRVLRTLLDRPDFGAGPPTIGAELEVALVDRAGRPLPLNVEVLQETLDPRMTVELDRFNLECNLQFGPLAGRPFAALRAELEGARDELGRAAGLHDGRIAMIGILPTIMPRDLAAESMTDTMRYRALAYALRQSRHDPFHLDIDGDDPLSMDCDDVTYEGAATSLQIHLRVRPDRFAALFNALQVATAPVLAVSGNSPMFVGHRLWSETRVALFKQAVDERDERARRSRRLPRVGFGSGWVRDGAVELFAEAVETFDPLLPVLDDEDPLATLARGETPKLGEVRLHQGTVWSWNRPVYDPAGGGHLRIELRALPSGPTIADMLANIALLVGVGYALADESPGVAARMSFDDAHNNFYRAAQQGPAATLAWPDGLAGIRSREGRLPAGELAAGLLPAAHRGLSSVGVDAHDFEPLLEIAAARARSGRTGAAWQRETFSQLARRMPTEDALAELVERYLQHSSSDLAVHDWPTHE